MPSLRCYFAACLAVFAVVLCAIAPGRGTPTSAHCEHCVLQDPELSSAIRAAEPADALAQKYAPIVYIRNQDGPCDRRGSPFLPVAVEFLFGQEDIVLYRHESGRNVEVARSFEAQDLYGLDNSYFIDTPGNPKRPRCTYEQDFLKRADAYPPVVYAHIATEDGRDGIAIQYWFYYYFNDWNNTHEGDWEMIQLTFEGPTVEDALTQVPIGVGYSQHAGGERSTWDDPKLDKEGTRPIAYAAAGANANQFQPNIILGRGDNGTGFGCDDASKPSRRVPLEAILVQDPTSADSEFAWLAFDGRWGERAPWEFNGPTGPNDKLAWTQPFTWQERLRPSSIIVPSRATLGPNAVNFFCDAVWYLSSPFSVLVRLPPIVLLGGFIATIGAVGFTLSRTRYRPVIDTPLRRPRRLGQMLSASVRLYRRNLALFLGIGIIYLPAAIVALGVQWLLSKPPLLDTVARFFSQSRGVEAVIALTIGNFTSSFVYWFVLAAATAAVGRLAHGRTGDALSSDLDVIRLLPALAVPRLKALVVVVLLTISVVGIPWAIRFAVRWAFIEEAILLDNSASKDAMSASQRTVDGRWWYTAACLVALSAIGFFAGPVMAFVMLFATSASVNFVNVVSSLVFAAVVPFVAVAQALLYFSLTTGTPTDASQRDD